MSKRFCFIGDSHVAAVRLALKSNEFARCRDSISVFGAVGTLLSTAIFRNRRLTSDEPKARKALRLTGGTPFIRLDAYDVFCVVGCWTSVNAANLIAKDYSSYRLGLPGGQLLSQELIDIMLIDRFRKSIAGTLIDLLAQATDKPIYLIPDPLWSTKVFEEPRGVIMGAIAKSTHAADYVDWVHRCLQSAFAGKATVLRQPADTVENSLFTKEAYSRNSISLGRRAAEHPEADFVHMNGAYGARILEEFFAEADKPASP